MSDRWEHTRFGLMVQANLAAVPAFAPIGQWADWYRAHLGDDVSHAGLQISPLVETLAHHRDRWAHVERYDDFLPFLTFDEFDPDGLVELVHEAGMGYLVATAKHHDGWCWWDAPNTDRRLADHGPQRNVISELATACERRDTMFGASYSLLDWGDPRHPNPAYVDDVVHPHLLDLVERYGIDILRGEGHWGSGGDHWRSDEILGRLRSISPELVINDRFWATTPGVRSLEYDLPDDITSEPWELTRGIGPSFMFNRAEPADQLMQPSEVISILTEVIAKGGHMTLAVGPTPTGTIPNQHASVLRDVGRWVRRHQRLVDHADPWVVWGDEACRYVTIDGALHVVDVTGAGSFASLTRDDHPVATVTFDGEPIAFRQDNTGLTIELLRQPRPVAIDHYPAVYEIDLIPLGAAPIALFPVERAASIPLASVIEDAHPGDLVQLGEGRYLGPARIPDGVTVRGLGSHRTTIDGIESEAIVLGTGSRIEHCDLTGGGPRIAWLARRVVRIEGDRASILACTVQGHVTIDGADQVRIASSTLNGVVATGTDQITITRCTLTGMGWDCAIDIDGGSGHLIESCDAQRSLETIRLHRASNCAIRANRLSGRWWSVHLIDCEATVVNANAIERSMRAVDVDGGMSNVVTGNAVFDGDSGCLVQAGAADTEVTGNHWERCRIGYFGWDTGPTRVHDNATVDITESDHITGP